MAGAGPGRLHRELWPACRKSVLLAGRRSCALAGCGIVDNIHKQRGWNYTLANLHIYLVSVLIGYVQYVHSPCMIYRGVLRVSEYGVISGSAPEDSP